MKIKSIVKKKIFVQKHSESGQINGLYFEPNLHPIQHKVEYKADFPDIDLDFLPEAREQIKAYITERYGKDCVCNVGTHIGYQPMAALHDAARAFGHGLKESEVVTKDLPAEFNSMDAETAKKEFPEVATFAEKFPDVFDMAYKMDGRIKTQGKHAGGVIISSVPLRDYMPLTMREGQWSSAWTEGETAQLSRFGFVKFDLLGITTLSYIYKCLKNMKENKGIEIEWDIDPEDDRAGWEILSDGTRNKIKFSDQLSNLTANTCKLDTIFQFDTDLAKSIIAKGKITNFNDFVVYTALGRPGPLKMIDDYIARRDGKKEWKEANKITEYLSSTFNVPTFQEQLTEIWQGVAGMTGPEAQAALKVIRKKKVDQMEKIKKKWMEGATRFLSKESAEKWWKKQEDFGMYAFNKCLAPTTQVITSKGVIKNINNVMRNEQVYTVTDNGIVSSKVVDIHKNGIKEIYRATFDDGSVVECTMDHKFLTDHGQVPLIDIFENKLSVRGISTNEARTHMRVSGKDSTMVYRRVIQLDYMGECETYDLEVDHPEHNFLLANGICTSNSHSVAYCNISFRCLWLKSHYTTEWWAACLEYAGRDKLSLYMNAARKDGVSFEPFHANYLYAGFTVKDEKIALGLHMIKGFGEKAAAEVAAKKKDVKDPIDTFEKFMNYYQLGRTQMEALIKLGAFDSFPQCSNRKALWAWWQYKYGKSAEDKEVQRDINWSLRWTKEQITSFIEVQKTKYLQDRPKAKKIPEKILNWAPANVHIDCKYEFQKLNINHKTPEFKMCNKIDATFEDILKLFTIDYTLSEKLAIEMEYFDFYWTSPMKQFKNRNYTIEKAKKNDILEGIITKVVEITTKKNDTFLKLFINDGLEDATVNIWSDQIERLNLDLISKGNGVIMSVKWDQKYQSFNMIDAKQMRQLERIC